ncbi:uncharacterized protein LOC132192720 [Neocloeon triangulifer]|uniref:uncharacterized protein LOC132192720 n=1 Tax=Neocloeon triangulifer TaxID=2078957 RepID=UPI00286F1234|nr:uncharacterized protein LOC132192720 [Neocloeon triangulifer]
MVCISPAMRTELRFSRDITSFLIFWFTMVPQKMMAEELECLSDFKNNFFENMDFSWRQKSREYQCLQTCRVSFQEKRIDSISTKPKFREAVFTPKQKFVNCLSESREILDVCRRKIRGLQLRQSGALPLYYFPENVHLSRFEAEKICRRHGLDFKIEISQLEKIKINSPSLDHVWAPIINTSTLQNTATISCFIYKRESSSFDLKEDGCGHKNQFVCTLPEICHSTFCIGNHQGKKGGQEFCNPGCPDANCNDEVAENFVISSTDTLIEACGRKYVISKSAHNRSYAPTFCCSRFMELASLETNQEASCLATELKKRKLANILLWTSGDLEPCQDSKSYTWCSGGEFVNQEALNLSLSTEGGKKSGLLVKALEDQEGLMVFQSEERRVNKRTLCESEHPKNCTQTKCLQIQCSYEIGLAKSVYKGINANYMKGIFVISGCGLKGIGINQGSMKNTFIGGYKWCCVSNGTLLTFETKEKQTCLENLFREKKVAKNRYWVSGASFGCPNINRWCNSRDEPLIGDHIMWAPGEPSKDPSKECVYADYDNVTSKFTFGKAGCKTALYYICEEVMPT